MNQRRHLTVIAAVTTLMAAAPLSSLFLQWTWLIQAIIAVALICAAALVARALRAPVWAQPIATLFALLLALTWLDADGHAFGGLLPSLDTFRHFGSLLSSAGTEMNVYGVPVDDHPGFLFLTTAGVGFVAILVDLLAVGLRRPALAGLPMLAIYAVPVEIDPHSVSVIAFAIGAAGFMWLLVTDNIDRVRLFGRRFTGEGRGVDMWEPSPLATVGRRLALIGVLLAIVIPVATPGLSRALIPALGGGNGTGGGKGTCHGVCLNGSVDLFGTLAGQLNNSKTTVLATVKTDEPVSQYLRFGVADHLTKAGFSPSSTQGEPVSQGLPNPPFTNPNATDAGAVQFAEHKATVTIKNLRIPLLPIYLAPITGTTQNITGGYSFDPDTAEIFSNKPTADGQSYTFSYNQPTYPADELAKAPSFTPSDPLEIAEGRPPVEVPEVVNIVKAQTKSATNEYETVTDLTNFFSRKNGFSYQVTTKKGTTGTDIGDFLQQRQGYCVQYASALAWLVREAGFPARVAFGFTEGTLLPGGTNTYQLTNQNLHAWTEVYFPTFGWVPFDVTPSADVQGSLRNPWQPDANNPTKAGAGTTAPEPSLGTGGSGSSSAKPHLRTDPGGTGGVGSTSHHDTTWGWWVLPGLLVALVIAAMPVVTRTILRGRRAAADRRVTSDSAGRGEPWVVVPEHAASAASTRRVHAAWDEFIDILVDYRVPVDPAETPRSTSERVVGSLNFSGEAAASTRLIGASEQRARYARHPGPGQPLDSGLRTIRQTLAARVSLRTRLRAQLLPPSVTQRWASWTVATISNSMARVQTAREAAGRMFSLRRLLSPKRATR